MRSPLPAALALFWLLAAAGLPAQVATPALRVLFLGNSLTDGNDVPALVQAMAQLQGVRVDYQALAPGGYAIEDHWRDGHQALLASGNFDVLILQQGPSTLPESQANLREWAAIWAAEARRFGTRPALYMIWPVRTQTNGFSLVSQSYRNAALATDAAIFPAGEAWQQVIRTNPSIALYSSDDLHATSAGSFLAAMVIARGLVGLEPTRVPASVRGLAVPAATLATFRTVVSALPPSTLTGLAANDSPASAGAGAPTPIDPQTVPSPGSPATPAAPTTNPIPAASPATGGSGGGGAPSGWFLLALLAVAAGRRGYCATSRREEDAPGP